MAPGREGEADETTSLLPNGTVEGEASERIAHNESAPDGGLGTSLSDNANETGFNGEPLTKSQSKDDRTKKYEGIPEVKKRMKYIFPALGIGVMLAAMDQTIIVTSAPRIGSDLDALNQTSWIATAYYLTLTSFQPLYGKLSDIFSRKSCLLLAYVIFGLGCLFCGLARNMQELIAARALAGIGGGGMTTVVSVLLSDVIPLRDRGAWQGYINIIYATGSSSGAPLGGFMADSQIGWRGSFLIQVPICLAAFFAVAFVLKLPPREEEQDKISWRVKLKRVDFLGAAVLVVAVFLLVFALDHGSNVTWLDSYALVPLGLSLLLIPVFLYVETRVASEPIAPGHIIFERTLFSCYLCNFFSFAGWLSAVFFIPLYYQAVDGVSATVAGALLIPGIIAGVSGSLFGGFFMQKTGKYYWITILCYSSLVVGASVVLVSAASPEFGFSNTWAIVGIGIASVISGFSNGIGVTTSLIALISNASRSDQAIATACSYLFRSLGSTTGMSLSSSAANLVLRARLRQELGSGSQAEEIQSLVRRSLSYIKTLEPGVRDTVRKCYGESTQAAFAVDIVLVAGAAASAWFIREKTLGR